METKKTRGHIDSLGRVVIPAAYRKALGLKRGDEILLLLEDGEVRITTHRGGLRKAQALVQKYVGKNKKLASELIEERRREAEGE